MWKFFLVWMSHSFSLLCVPKVEFLPFFHNFLGETFTLNKINCRRGASFSGFSEVCASVNVCVGGGRPCNELKVSQGGGHASIKSIFICQKKRFSPQILTQSYLLCVHEREKSVVTSTLAGQNWLFFLPSDIYCLYFILAADFYQYVNMSLFRYKKDKEYFFSSFLAILLYAVKNHLYWIQVCLRLHQKPKSFIHPVVRN